MTPSEPPQFDNAQLHRQVAELSERVVELESRNRELRRERDHHVESEILRRSLALTRSEALLAESQRDPR